MSRRTQKNVGVIGLGIIGRRVADCLRRRGFHAFVWNHTPRPYPNFVGSPAENAELCDFIQIFVSNDAALLEIVQQMKPSLKAHHVVMAHSTVAPETVREAGEIVKRRGGQLLDAPFTGSKGAAETGELVYYVAGDDGAYRRARPVLDASSKEIIEIGEIGEAMLIKVATNMITAATVQAAAEALALVDRAGIPLEKFSAAMRSNGSNSGTLTMKLPKMVSGDFDTQFSVKHMLKDVEIASRLARKYHLQLGVNEVARESLIEEANRGGADSDYSAVIRTFFPEPTAAAPEAEPELPEPEHVKAAEPEPHTPALESSEAKAPEVVEEKEAEPEARKEEPVEEKREVEQPAAERELKTEEEPAQRNGSEEHPVEVQSKRTDEITAEEPAPPQRTEPDAQRELEPETADEAPADREQRDEPEPEAEVEEEHEPELRRPEEEEIGNASTAVEPEDAERVATARVEKAKEEEEPRGFFSRIFGRSSDY